MVNERLVIIKHRKSAGLTLRIAMHLLGLSDRYDEFRDNNMIGKGREGTSIIGFEHDLMSLEGLKLDVFYYIQHIDWANALRTYVKSLVIPLDRTIDVDNKGRRLTPYEPKHFYEFDSASD